MDSWRQARPRVTRRPPIGAASAAGASTRAIVVKGGGEAGRGMSKGDAVLENVRDDNYALQVIAGLQLNGTHAPARPSAPPETRAFARKSWALKSVTLLSNLSRFSPLRDLSPRSSAAKIWTRRINYFTFVHRSPLNFYYVYCRVYILSTCQSFFSYLVLFIYY